MSRDLYGALPDGTEEEGEGEQDAPPGYRPQMAHIVRTSQGRSNVRITPYWSSIAEEDEEVVEKLRHAFNGEQRIETAGAAPKLSYHCTALQTIKDNLDAYIDIVDSHGVRAVHGAALNGYTEVVKLLVDAGADPFERTVDGVDALVIARARGHRKIVEYLSDIEPILRRVRERREAEVREKQARLDAKAAASDARKRELDEKTRREAEIREFKAKQKEDAMKKAQEEARLREEAASGIDPIMDCDWHTLPVQIDTRRYIGYYPRKPA